MISLTPSNKLGVDLAQLGKPMLMIVHIPYSVGTALPWETSAELEQSDAYSEWGDFENACEHLV